MKVRFYSGLAILAATTKASTLTSLLNYEGEDDDLAQISIDDIINEMTQTEREELMKELMGDEEL